MRENRIKHKLRQGQTVTVVSGHDHTTTIDFLGQFGFDGVWLEGEHGPLSWEQIGDMSRACDLWGVDLGDARPRQRARADHARPGLWHDGHRGGAR